MTFGGRDNRGPSIAELQRFIREKTPLIFTLTNGEKVVGQLRWVDENAFQIVPDGQQPFTILRSAVLGYTRKDGQSSQAAGKKQKAQAEKEPATVAASESESGSASEIRADDIGS